VGPNENYLVLLSFFSFTRRANNYPFWEIIEASLLLWMVPKVLGAKSMANLIFSMFPENANCLPTIPLGSRTILISLEDFVFFP
jgi:hypothetical protein